MMMGPPHQQLASGTSCMQLSYRKHDTLVSGRSRGRGGGGGYSKLTRVSGLLKVLHSTDFPPKWPHDLVNSRNNCTHILLFASSLLELEPCTFGGTIISCIVANCPGVM